MGDTRMSSGFNHWLSRLPLADEQAADGIVLTGRVFAGGLDQVHVLVDDLRLTFRAEDIVEVEEVPTSGGDRLHLAPRVFRVVVRPGAPLQDARPGELCERPSPGRRPFALSVRPPVITLGPATRFRDLEREFLLSQGLIDR
ncbi:MAG TPA: hypothetical protein VIL34_09390 [Actinopolymorphaceae bacterium]|jgi:hypothetical protein